MLLIWRIDEASLRGRMWVERLFDSPYYSRSTMLARYACNFATLMWCGAISLLRDALRSAGSSYAWVDDYVSEDAIAGCLGTLAVIQLVWLVLKLPPMHRGRFQWGSLGYGLMAVWWFFVWFSGSFAAHHLQPTSFAGAATVCALSFYGFMSNPLPPHKRRAADREAA